MPLRGDVVSVIGRHHVRLSSRATPSSILLITDDISGQNPEPVLPVLGPQDATWHKVAALHAPLIKDLLQKNNRALMTFSDCVAFEMCLAFDLKRKTLL